MKRSKVIIAVIAIIAVVAAACVYGYVRSKPADEPEKPAVTEPENPTTPETPDDSNSGKPSDSKTDEPAVQPENPNPSGTESVTIYVPDEQGETLTPTGADAKDDSDQYSWTHSSPQALCPRASRCSPRHSRTARSRST